MSLPSFSSSDPRHPTSPRPQKPGQGAAPTRESIIHGYLRRNCADTYISYRAHCTEEGLAMPMWSGADASIRAASVSIHSIRPFIIWSMCAKPMSVSAYFHPAPMEMHRHPPQTPSYVGTIGPPAPAPPRPKSNQTNPSLAPPLRRRTNSNTLDRRIPTNN